MPRYEERKQTKWLRYLIKRQHGLCAYCGKKMVRGHRDLHPTFDHVTAFSRGGAHHLENGAAACRRCNSAKGAKSTYCHE